MPRFTDKKLRALFAKFGDILSIKLESKFGVVKVPPLPHTHTHGVSEPSCTLPLNPKPQTRSFVLETVIIVATT